MKSPLRVLNIEDSPSDSKLVAIALRALDRGIEVFRVEEEVGFRAALERGGWDLIISDWSMPRFSALTALAILRERQIDVPFIIVSGTIGEGAAVEAMRAGAHDYVLKDQLARLVPAVERELKDCAGRAARQEAEEGLRLSEARFRALIEKSQDGISLANAEGVTLYTSPTGRKILGLPEDDAGGRSAFQNVHPGDRERIGAIWRQVLEQRSASASFDFRVVRPDGAVRWLEGSGTNLLHDPAVRAVVANYRDITERKLAVDGLRQSEEQLRHAQKMEAVGTLAGAVAHDFNNILTVILSHAEVLLEDLGANDPARVDVDAIRKAGARAADLTRQLLLFSRQQVVQPKVLDPGSVLGGMEKILRRLVGEDIELTVTWPPDIGKIKMDPGHVDQVIMNLVVNARDAMPHGGRLTIEAANVVLDQGHASDHLGIEPGPHVMFAVTDTGTGIDKATQARMFEPFFTTKERGKGTGLGLSTVFGIVRQSHGTIWVYSEPGHGATFKVYLPRTDQPTDDLQPQTELSAVRGSETILLVEDEEPVRTVARDILKRQGYRVIEAQNGGEALLICEQTREPIHLLLTDVVLPRMSGPELIRRLREIRPEMRALCMSGYTDEAVVRHGIIDSSMAFLQKPLTPAALARRVREVLGHGGS